jgi:DNA-binding SARP family transcriptional activator
MSMAFEKREAACLEFIRSGFKTEATVQWMLKEYANETTIQRATHPDKLCRNIITMGGSGDQQQLNCVAFRSACDTHIKELSAKQEATLDAKYKALELDYERMRDRHDDAENRATKYGEEVRELQNRLNNMEREKHSLQLQLQAGAVEDPASKDPVAA